MYGKDSKGEVNVWGGNDDIIFKFKALPLQICSVCLLIECRSRREKQMTRETTNIEGLEDSPTSLLQILGQVRIFDSIRSETNKCSDYEGDGRHDASPTPMLRLGG